MRHQSFRSLVHFAEWLTSVLLSTLAYSSWILVGWLDREESVCSSVYGMKRIMVRGDLSVLWRNPPCCEAFIKNPLDEKPSVSVPVKGKNLSFLWRNPPWSDWMECVFDNFVWRSARSRSFVIRSSDLAGVAIRTQTAVFFGVILRVSMVDDRMIPSLIQGKNLCFLWRTLHRSAVKKRIRLYVSENSAHWRDPQKIQKLCW